MYGKYFVEWCIFCILFYRKYYYHFSDLCSTFTNTHCVSIKCISMQRVISYKSFYCIIFVYNKLLESVIICRSHKIITNLIKLFFWLFLSISLGYGVTSGISVLWHCLQRQPFHVYDSIAPFDSISLLVYK